MNIFRAADYREALQEAIELKKKSDAGITLSMMAKTCQMQPSYLTNVLKGRCHLNSDQLFRLGEILDCNAEEQEFLALLLEFERTAYAKRKTLLQTKIKTFRARHLRAEKNLTTKTVELSPEQTEKYYLDPFIQLVHIQMSSTSEPQSLEQLARIFTLSHQRMRDILDVLEEILYVRKKGGKYEVLVQGRHLPRESPILKPHQILMRIKSLEQIQRLEPERIYSFSATISTSPEIRTKLQAEFLKFLKAAEKLVKDHPPEKLYQINFDLFPWELED